MCVYLDIVCGAKQKAFDNFQINLFRFLYIFVLDFRFVSRIPNGVLLICKLKSMQHKVAHFVSGRKSWPLALKELPVLILDLVHLVVKRFCTARKWLEAHIVHIAELAHTFGAV